MRHRSRRAEAPRGNGARNRNYAPSASRRLAAHAQVRAGAVKRATGNRDRAFGRKGACVGAAAAEDGLYPRCSGPVGAGTQPGMGAAWPMRGSVVSGGGRCRCPPFFCDEGLSGSDIRRAGRRADEPARARRNPLRYGWRWPVGLRRGWPAGWVCRPVAAACWGLSGRCRTRWCTEPCW
jgi:hypothetical protein